MDWQVALSAALLGVVEGITEFLPISSTGHLILLVDALGFRFRSRLHGPSSSLSLTAAPGLSRTLSGHDAYATASPNVKTDGTKPR